MEEIVAFLDEPSVVSHRVDLFRQSLQTVELLELVTRCQIVVKDISFAKDFISLSFSIASLLPDRPKELLLPLLILSHALKDAGSLPFNLWIVLVHEFNILTAPVCEDLLGMDLICHQFVLGKFVDWVEYPTNCPKLLRV
jgi:hypothetical protein